MPTITRVHSLTAIAGLGLALFACSDDDIRSDLNTEGAPRVITVTATSQSTGETATYCGDPAVEKLNELYCSEDPEDGPQPMLTDTQPIGWETRVVFNELLFAADVETLIDVGDVVLHGSLLETQPVNINCGGLSIPYDGFYQPAGNHLTQTPGPSIVIQPIFPGAYAATGSTCELTVRSDIRGKDLETVTMTGPYSFQIAALDVDTTQPATDSEVDVDAEIKVLFNGLLDGNTLSNIELADSNGTPHPILVRLDDDPTTSQLNNGRTAVILSANGAFDPGTEYTLTVNSGVADIRGGQFTGPFTMTFQTLSTP